MITIDGSFGEGGGQVLRTSLALSLVTGTPLRIENIRAKRKTSGLLRQHLTAVNAAAEIGGAEISGASIGSLQLTFAPSRVVPGDYAFAVGTAGSATLVLQTVLPPLLLASGPSRLTLEGGTHNPMAPPFDFISRVFLPAINRMGPRVSATLERAGFYPAGKGRFTVAIEPAARLARLDLPERGNVIARRGRAVVANLPRSVGERELSLVARKLSWSSEWLSVEEATGSPGPGNVIMLEVESEHVTELFTGFGERGVRAEQVADYAVQAVERYLMAGVAAGEHLADQLLLPLALAGGGSFSTLPLSRHAITNIEIIRNFLDVSIAAEVIDRRGCMVEVTSH